MMRKLLLLFALTFHTGCATEAPMASAEAITTVAQEAEPCCPEWLCRLLCWWCEPCEPTPGGCEDCCAGGACPD